jgi:hypothetical protein
MPARDMMLEEMPIHIMGTKARSTATGMVTMGTMAEGMCQRKTRITRLTITTSWTSFSFRLSMARSMRSERS